MKTKYFFLFIGVLSLIFIFEIFTVSVRMRVNQYLKVFEVNLGGGGVCNFFLNLVKLGMKTTIQLKKCLGLIKKLWV